MPLDILICLFPDLLPPTSHEGPASVLWVLLERDGFLQQHPPQHRGLSMNSLFSRFPFGRGCPQIVQPYCVVLREGLHCVTSGGPEPLPVRKAGFPQICFHSLGSAQVRFSLTVVVRSWGRSTGSSAACAEVCLPITRCTCG